MTIRPATKDGYQAASSLLSLASLVPLDAFRHSAAVLIAVGRRYYMGVRSCISILMNLVLALTFLQAPFLHVHEHESTANHSHRFFHTHFPHHHFSASKSPEFRVLDPDDDAVFQQWFSATISDPSTPAYILTSIYTIAPVRSSEPFFQLNILGGHDPPRRSRSSPRSPPV